MSLVVSGTPLIIVLLVAIATIVTAVVRLKMLSRALEDTQPQERPEIIRALRGLWKSEWQFGQLRRTGPRRRRGHADNILGLARNSPTQSETGE